LDTNFRQQVRAVKSSSNNAASSRMLAHKL
jgi:hypothetical protein